MSIISHGPTLHGFKCSLIECVSEFKSQTSHLDITSPRSSLKLIFELINNSDNGISRTIKRELVLDENVKFVKKTDFYWHILVLLTVPLSILSL